MKRLKVKVTRSQSAKNIFHLKAIEWPAYSSRHRPVAKGRVLGVKPPERFSGKGN